MPRSSKFSIASSTRAKLILVLALTFNLGLLAYYKYAGFFLGNLNLAASGSFSLENIALPLAISFYTFQQVSFQVDVWRRHKMNYGLLDYAAYVAFFPQLIAGPIVRHGELIPQFASSALRPGLHERLSRGATLFLIGVVKKAVIADYLSDIVNPVYAAAATGDAIPSVDAWIAAIASAWQVYFDFSGYTDMALGLALMFGFKLPLNFNIPFMAASITEFWKRWHMTLSRFLRDYMFMPMARLTTYRSGHYIALFVTMTLAGLWHGAGWTFVIWGALHGGALLAHKIWKQSFGRMPKPAGIALTLFFLFDTMVLFRAESLSAVMQMWYSMHTWVPLDGKFPFKELAVVILVGIIAMAGSTSQTIALVKLRPSSRTAVMLGLVFTALLLWIGRDQGAEFIYFQF